MEEMSKPLDLLSGGTRRPRVHDAQIPFKLPQTVRDLLKDEAKRIGVTEAAVIRAAIGEYLGRRGY